MIALLSPAKTLDFDSDLQLGSLGQALFPEQAQQVMEELARKKPAELTKLQQISDKLAQLNYERNQQWQPRPVKGQRQAALAFKGDVYQGMEAHNWSEADMDFARQHLLILSGLYGILRPHDGILPYRLEMGTRLSVQRQKNLYSFWKKTVAQYFEDHLPADVPLLNLASNEYFRLIKEAAPANPVVEIDFKDFSKGKYKVISFYAKKARGMMVNFMVQNRLSDVNQLKDFNLGGYYWDEQNSTNGNLIFLRDKQQ